VTQDLSLWRASDTFGQMMEPLPMYERPRLERYGTFRELTQVSLNLGAFAVNPSVLSGATASCDCIPGDVVVDPPRRS
jgi:hypothetical protein